MEIPQKYKDLVGTSQKFVGPVLSYKNNIEEPTIFYIKDIRWGTAKVMDMDTMKMKHPTFQLLLIRNGMKRAQWSKPMPIPEIELTDED